MTLTAASAGAHPMGLRRTPSEETEAGPKAEIFLDGTALLIEKHGRLTPAPNGSAPYAASQTIGSTRDFYAYGFDTDSYYSTSATLMAIGDRCYIYVESDQVDEVSQEDIDDIVEVFDDSATSDAESGIYDILTDAMGSAPDIDDDPRIILLVLNTEGVGGYFDPLNSTTDQNSNQTEMVYIDSSHLRVRSIAAHEFAHLLDYGHNGFHSGFQGSALFMIEGLASVAEFLCGYGIPYVSSFQRNPPSASLTHWPSGAAQTRYYGRACLWMLYLYERHGGLETFKRFAQSDRTGMSGVDEDLQEAGSTAAGAYLDWVAAIYADDESYDSGRYSIQNADIQVGPSKSHTQFPVEETSGTLKPWQTRYIEFEAPSDAAGDLYIIITAPSGLSARLMLFDGDSLTGVRDLDVSDPGVVIDFGDSVDRAVATLSYTSLTAADDINYTYRSYIESTDLTSPTVTVSGPSEPQSGAFYAQIVFSEKVTGFEQNDIVVVNGSIAGFSGQRTDYQVSISPDRSGAISVSVPANVAQDLAGNSNVASNVLTVPLDTAEASDFSISPNPAGSGQTVTISANIEEGSTASFTAEGLDEVKGNLTVDEDADAPDGFNAASATFDIPDDTSAESAEITLTVTDSNANTTTYDAGTLTIDTAAEASDFSISPNPAGSGQTVTISANIEEGSTASFTVEGLDEVKGNLTVDEDADAPDGFSAASATFVIPNDSGVESAEITLTVTDSLENETEHDAGTLTIVVDKAEASDFSISPNPAGSGQTVTVSANIEEGSTASFTAEGLDEVKGNLTVDEDADAPDGFSAASATFTIPDDTSVESAEITLTVTDSNANTTTYDAGTLTIDTVAKASDFSISPNPAGPGQTVTISANIEEGASASFNVEGVDGAEGDLTTDADADAPEGFTAASATFVIPNDSSIESAEITLTVTDSLENETEHDAGTLTIDTAAKASDFSISPNPAGPGQTVTIRANIEEGASASFAAEGLDGAKGDLTTDENADAPDGFIAASAKFVIPNDSGIESAEITLTVTDSLENETEHDAGTLTIDTAAKASDFSISPNPAGSGQTVTISANIEQDATASFIVEGVDGAEGDLTTDADADAPEGFIAASATFVIPNDSGVESAEITLTVTDSLENETEHDVGTLTIDTVAKASNIVVSPNPAVSGQTVTISAYIEEGATASFILTRADGAKAKGDLATDASVDAPEGFIAASGSFDVADGLDIEYTKVALSVTDSVGNTATYDAGTLTMIAVSPNLARPGQTVTISAYIEEGASASFNVEGVEGAKGDLTTDASADAPDGFIAAAASFDIPDGLDIEYTRVALSVTDSFGNTTTYDVGTLTIDTAAEASDFSILPNPAGPGQTVTISAYIEEGASASFIVEGVDGAEGDLTTDANADAPDGFIAAAGSFDVADGSEIEDAAVKVTVTDSLVNTTIYDAGTLTILADIAEASDFSISPNPVRSGQTAVVRAYIEQGASASFIVEGVEGAKGDLTTDENADAPDGFIAAAGSFIVVDGSDIEDAAVTLTVTDSLGNETEHDAGTLTIDTTAPAGEASASVDSARSGDAFTVSAASEESGLTAALDISSLDTTQSEPIALTESADGVYSVEVTVSGENAAEDGEKTITVTLTDAAGNATAIDLTIELRDRTTFTLELFEGLNLIHIPVKDESIATVGDLYDALGGSEDVEYIVSKSDDGTFVGYVGIPGSAGDTDIRDQTALLVGMKRGKSAVFTGAALNDSAALSQGINLIGVPRAGAVLRASEIAPNASAVLALTRDSRGNTQFSLVQPNTPHDVEITGGQGFIVVMDEAETIRFEGSPWADPAE